MLAFLAFAPPAGAYLFWTNSNISSRDRSIGRANLDGTGVNQAFIDDVNFACGLATDGAYVYWADTAFSEIGRADFGGGHISTLIYGGQGQPVNNPCGVAVDSSHIYWTNGGYLVPPAIGRANLDGSGARTLIPGGNAPCGVAVDSTHVYWANAGDFGGGTTIGRANLDGTDVDQSFINGANGPCGVAVDGQHVYWANWGAGSGSGTTIGRANLEGAGVDQSFITGANSPSAVTVDNTHIYWANSGALGNGTTIGRADLDGSGVSQSFITGADTPRGVAIGAPSNEFSLGKPKRNKRKGTAKLPVNVSSPGTVRLQGEGLKRQKMEAPDVGEVKMPVKPRGHRKKKLKRKGKVKVSAHVVFHPEAGALNFASKTIKLVRRR